MTVAMSSAVTSGSGGLVTMLASVFLTGILNALNGHISDFFQYDTSTDKILSGHETEDSFDFIIVGSGSAGALVASRLSENYKVLVLEAGGEPHPLQRIPAMSGAFRHKPGVSWDFVTEPQKYACQTCKEKRLTWSPGKQLGGSGSMNCLTYFRGHWKDFENWANVTGDERWNYENVLKFYKMHEDYHGEWDDAKYHSHGGGIKVSEAVEKDMADAFLKAAEEFGYPHTDLNANYTQGFSTVYYARYKGFRSSTYLDFLKPAMSRPNLSVYKYAHVTKVIFAEGPENRAIGVQYTRHGINKTAYAKKEVILSAGALNSPKVLMLSGIGDEDHLQAFNISVRKHLPAVGKNLQDHAGGYLGIFTVDKPVVTEGEMLHESVLKLIENGTGLLTSTGLEAAGFVVSDYAKKKLNNSDWPDTQFMLETRINRALLLDLPFTKFTEHSLDLEEEVSNKFWGKIKGDNNFFHVVSLLARPFSRGEVTLQSADPFIRPKVDPKLLSDERDIKVAVSGARQIVDIVENSKAFKAYNVRILDIPFPGCEDVPFKSDAYWECYLRQFFVINYNHAGTCAMGRKDSPRAVVDSELRVIGTKHLRVIDASIMPDITTSSTNAVTIMIGEMGAGFVKSAWRETR